MSKLTLSPVVLEKLRSTSKFNELKDVLENNNPKKVPKKPLAKPKKVLFKKDVPKKKSGYREFLKRYNAVMGWLSKKYPLCFKDKEILPMKIGIINDIFLTLPEEFSRRNVRSALRFYTSSKTYLQSLIDHPYRYNLAGEQVDEVTEDAKILAKSKLESEK